MDIRAKKALFIFSSSGSFFFRSRQKTLLCRPVALPMRGDEIHIHEYGGKGRRRRRKIFLFLGGRKMRDVCCARRKGEEKECEKQA